MVKSSIKSDQMIAVIFLEMKQDPFLKFKICRKKSNKIIQEKQMGFLKIISENQRDSIKSLCVTRLRSLFNIWIDVKYKNKKKNYVLESFYLDSMLPNKEKNSSDKADISNMEDIRARSNHECFINPNLLSIIYFQNYLCLELLQNQKLIACYIPSQIKQETSWTPEREMNKEINEEHLQHNFVTHSTDQKEKIKQEIIQQHHPPSPKRISQKKVRKNVQKYSQFKYFNDDSDYEPRKQGSGSDRCNKTSQSKNVPKNFSKAILLFIKREEKTTRKLVNKYGIDFEEFIERTMSLKGRINSIAELRALWMDQQNNHAQIYRILSSIYIRKYSFEHIFNSRVENYSKHLKYRHKMLQVLERPHQFRNMKDY